MLAFTDGVGMAEVTNKELAELMEAVLGGIFTVLQDYNEHKKAAAD